jgi:hypothetical protein
MQPAERGSIHIPLRVSTVALPAELACALQLAPCLNGAVDLNDDEEPTSSRASVIRARQIFAYDQSLPSSSRAPFIISDACGILQIRRSNISVSRSFALVRRATEDHARTRRLGTTVAADVLDHIRHAARLA